MGCPDAARVRRAGRRSDGAGPGEADGGGGGAPGYAGLPSSVSRLSRRRLAAGLRNLQAARRSLRPHRAGDLGASHTMDFTLTREQQMLRETVRAFADEVLKPRAAGF